MIQTNIKRWVWYCDVCDKQGYSLFYAGTEDNLIVSDLNNDHKILSPLCESPNFKVEEDVLVGVRNS